LFLSEIPTALFLVVFTILAIKWIRSPRQDWYFLMMGGVLGIAVLIRLQSAVLLAPMALMTVLPLWASRRFEWLRGVLLITLGGVLTFSPWLVRNYFAAGGLVMDNPISQSMTFARRWSGDNGNTFLPQLADETTAQYVSRMNGIAIESFKHEPARILNGAANHFFNNLIASLHTFPVRDRIESPTELLWPAHAFWQTGARSPLLSTFYVFLLTLGLAVAWTIHRWAGLLPFVFSLGYNAWTALFLSSGDRFLLPIDWTWHLYYALGLLTLSRAALSGMQNIQWGTASKDDGKRFDLKPARWWTTILITVLILCVGASLPLTELVFPEKYPAQTQEQLSTELGVAPMEGEMILYGRAIYPRYYQAGDGEPDTAKLGYGINDEARLVFYLVGPRPGLIIFPLESAPDFFPHASDVWIIGMLEGDEFRPRIVKVSDGTGYMIYGK
jgi:4-amino-4-deoxy-L-arabinose transferase-like glycosyltransferase